MGDRATFQVVFDKEFSPIGYVHWAGSRMLEMIRAAAPYMRQSDASYAFARLCGHIHNQTGGDTEVLSLAVSNTDHIHTDDELGCDNGHFLIDLSTRTIKQDGKVIAKKLEFSRS